MNISDATRQLESADPAERRAAADFLSRQGEGLAEVAAQLVSHTGDDDRVVAEFCVAALEELGPPTPSQLEELSRLLTSPRDDVVYWSATLLGRAEQGAASYAPQLYDVAASDRPLEVRRRAVVALRKLGPSVAPLVPRLTELQRDAPAGLTRDIALTLAALQP